MSKSKIDEIREIESILVKAKNRDPHKYGTVEDEDIVIDAYNAISKIEANGFIELKKYLYHFLNDPDSYLREIAITAFGGFTLDEVPDLKEIAYSIWNDNNEETYIRFVALQLWYAFFVNTQDHDAIILLYKLIRNEFEDLSIRKRAYAGILEVSGILSKGEGSRLCINNDHLVNDNDEFMRWVNWNQINEIMKQYAPEILKN